MQRFAPLLLLILTVCRSQPQKSSGDDVVDASGTSGSASPHSTSVVPAPPGMTAIPGGKFFAGIPVNDKGLEPGHEVTLSPFLIDTTETTVEAYLCANRIEHAGPAKVARVRAATWQSPQRF